MSQLFKPLQIGAMQIGSRIVIAPNPKYRIEAVAALELLTG